MSKITINRAVVEQALDALKASRDRIVEAGGSGWKLSAQACTNAIAALRATLAQPQGEQEPYLYYDPENGDTWTQEAINDGFRLPDGLIALYTK